MSLRAGAAGSGPVFEGSLAQSIDSALVAETFRLKGRRFPPAGEEDRRMLCAAIAQGVLDYLARNQQLLEVVVTDPGAFPHVQARLEIHAPRITVTRGGGTAFVSGENFTPSRPVTLRWVGEPAPQGSASANSSGAFGNASLSLGALSLPKTIVAADDRGCVAFREVRT